MADPCGAYVAPTRLPHILVVKADEDGDRDFTLRCPHPSDPPPPCATWEPCGCETSKDEDDDPRESAYEYEPCPNQPGLRHVYDGQFSNEMVAGIGSCWPAQHPDLRDALDGSDLANLPPGEYPVQAEAEDGGEWMSVALATAASADLGPTP